IAHLAAAAIGLWLPQAAPLASAARQFMPEEWAVVALALAAGIIAAMWPAWRAYRLDVAATLAEGWPHASPRNHRRLRSSRRCARCCAQHECSGHGIAVGCRLRVRAAPRA